VRAVDQSIENLSHDMAAGTLIPVEIHSVVDSSFTRSPFLAGIVSNDVIGLNGKIALPAGSALTMSIRAIGREGSISRITIGLYSVNVFGHQYSLTTGESDAASVTIKEDAGKGSAHSAVHLQYGYTLDFKLDRAVELH
jgi:hypothetical protein